MVIGANWVAQFDGLMKKRCNSISNADELRLLCFKPSKWPVGFSFFSVP